MKLLLVFLAIIICSVESQAIKKELPQGISFINYPDALDLFGKKRMSIA